MKININILYLISIALLLSACRQSHTEGDGHNHRDDTEQQREAGHQDEAATIAALSREQMAAVGIQLDTLVQKNLTAVVKANGVLRVPNNNKANVTSLYGGVIKTLAVQLGDRVRKGQVIATVTHPQFIQLQEEYLTVSSQMALAELEVQRQEELNAGNAGARKNLEAAGTQLSTLRARQSSLQQQLRLMGINPAGVSNGRLRSTLQVISPINGVVSNVFVNIGSYVDVAAPVVEIVDNSLLHLDLQVFEKDLPAIKLGQLVDFTVTNNPSTNYSAKVFSIGASFEGDSKSVSVHCTVTGNKAGLIDGMNTVGVVSLNQVRLPAVPSEAIVEADGKYYIFMQTDKVVEEQHDEEGQLQADHAGHTHAHDDNDAQQAKTAMLNFEKIEVAKGVSELGYTAVSPVSEIPPGAQVVVKGGFFINAKLSNTGGHSH